MKKQRQSKILQLISQNCISRQEELAELLNKSGFIVTQATVSRDIKDLRLVKILDSSGKYKYALAGAGSSGSLDNEKYFNIIREGAVSVDFAVNLVIVKCHTGMAGAVCSALDATAHESIVGTLAGDDTIFIAVRSEDKAAALAHDIAVMI